MATATEGKYAGEYLAGSQADLGYINDDVVVLFGQSLAPGDVVGKVSIAGIGRVSVATVVGTGDGTASLVTAGPLAQVGNYVATCTTAATHGGVFTVVAPDGSTVGTLTMTGGTGATSAFRSKHINFSITDGSTDFIVGDAFTFVVGTTAPTVIGGTGTGTISSLSLGSKAQRGNYKLICTVAGATHGGTFQGIAPDGSIFGTFIMPDTSTTATPFTSDHINFTLTDATNFIVGNYFNVAVYGPAAPPKVAKWDPTATDGRQYVAGIAFDTYDASAADLDGVITARGPVLVNGAELSWLATVGAGDQAFGKQALTALGIVVR